MIYRRGHLPIVVLQNKATLRPVDDDLFRFLNEQDENLAQIFENGLSFADNFDMQELDFTSNAVANTEDSVAHALGRVPVGFIVITLNKGAVLYNGGTADTVTAIHLKSTVASTTFKILVF